MAITEITLVSKGNTTSKNQQSKKESLNLFDYQ